MNKSPKQDFEKIKQVLLKVKNPETGNTLSSEDRWKDFSESKGSLVMTYNRNGISPEQKRRIEEEIFSLLKGDWEESRIIVKTVSTEFSGNTSQKETPPKASLKVGHEGANKKKRVEGVGALVAISSCKGGVGKSTVAVNLALSLSHLGAKVGILDADIYGPSIPTLLGEKTARPSAGKRKKIRPFETKGLRFISFGLFVDEKEAVIWRGPMLGGVLNQFLFDTEWGEIDYLILDLPPGTGDIQLSMIQNTEVDLALIVSTPQHLALLDTRKGIEMFKKLGVEIGGLIENMSYFVPDESSKKYYIFGDGGGARLASDLGIDLLAEIPLEMALREGSDIGWPYMANPRYEGRPVWGAYMQMASRLDRMIRKRLPEKTKKKGPLSRLFKK